METSQALSIESFSYSWLVNLKPSSLENLDTSLRPSLDASDTEASNSFIEMDPRMPPSKRFFNISQDFKFDFPYDDDGLVDADELFSNGYLMPLFLNNPSHSSINSNSITLPSSSSHAPKPTRCSSLKRCRTLSAKMFHKYLNFLRPLCRRLRGLSHNQKSSSSSFETSAKRGDSVKKMKNKVCYTSEASPRISVAYSADDWRKSCDSETSIYEAVLHCKRSIGMSNSNFES